MAHMDGVKTYAKALIKWMLLAVGTGIVCGAVGVGFYYCVMGATALRAQEPRLIFLLPAAGVLIALMYSLLDMKKDGGTNAVLDATHSEKKVPVRMAALIFISTVITHLFGGSAGREGAALQIGGGLATALAKLLRVDEKTRHIVTLCGMSAVFSALFGTPVTAAVFCIEVVSVGYFASCAVFPCVVSAICAYGIAALCGVEAEAYSIIAPPAFALKPALAAGALGVVCALISIVLCISMHKSRELFENKLPNRYIRVAVGGAMVLLMTLAVGSQDYNGAGGQVIARAIAGEARPYDFALKLLFTAITLGCGFKGGEIVPSFFIGATLGCVLGPLLGVSASFGAALCMVAVFCGAVNCPIAGMMLSIELFGSECLSFFAIACALSFVLSGKFSLYVSQGFVFSKLEGDLI